VLTSKAAVSVEVRNPSQTLLPGGIKMVGRFDDLEDELLAFTTLGYTGSRSPNRADWFVWAIYELFPGLTKKEKDTHKIYTVPQVQGFGYGGR